MLGLRVTAPRRSSRRTIDDRVSCNYESEPEQCARNARTHANFLGFPGGGNSFCPNERKARSPQLGLGIPIATAGVGSLFLRRIRDLSRDSETSDPLLPRFPGASPLARRGVRSARPHGGSGRSGW